MTTSRFVVRCGRYFCAGNLEWQSFSFARGQKECGPIDGQAMDIALRLSPGEAAAVESSTSPASAAHAFRFLSHAKG